MGLPGLFEYRNAKGCIVAVAGLRCVFHLLHALAPVEPGSRLGGTIIPDRRLELVHDDGACYVVVLVEFKMG